jgi:hypothetical protein
LRLEVQLLKVQRLEEQREERMEEGRGVGAEDDSAIEASPREPLLPGPDPPRL